MSTFFRMVPVAAALAMAAGAAQAASNTEVAQARADCAAHKQKVLSLESQRRSEGDRTLERAKLEWEHACQRAELLMNGMRVSEPVITAYYPRQ